MQKSIYIHHNKKRLLSLAVNSLLLFIPIVFIGLWAIYTNPESINDSKLIFATSFVIIYTYFYFVPLSFLQPAITQLINPQPAFIVNKEGLFNLFSPHLPPFIKLDDIKAVTFRTPPPSLHFLRSALHLNNHHLPQPFLIIKKRSIYETSQSPLISSIINNTEQTIKDLAWPLYPSLSPPSVKLDELLFAIKELQVQNNK
jgi:hypothetical protein